MSAPGQPMDPMTKDFLATRSRASAGDDAWIQALAGQSGGTGGGAATGAQPAPGASAPAAPPPTSAPAASAGSDDASLPFGLRVENSILAKARQLEAEKTQKLPDFGALFTGDIGNAWNGLKTDFTKLMQENRGALQAPDENVWAGIQHSFARQLLAGKTVKDAFGLALSPLAGAFDETTSALAKGTAAIDPTGHGAPTYKRMWDQAMLGLGDTGAMKLGDLSDAAKASAESVKAADVAAPPPDGGAAAAAAPKPARVFDIAGEEPGSALNVTPELRKQAADFFAGKRDAPIDVHLDSLADEATRSEAVNQIAKVIPKDGVKPIDVTNMAAYSLNMTPEDVMASLKPNFPSDEKFSAATMAMNSAGKVFWDAARKAQETGTPEDFESATRAYALYNQFAGAFRDAKTDWGRAGRIQQEAQSARSDFTNHIQSIIEDVGGDNVEAIVKRAAALDDPSKVPPFTSSLRSMSARDGILFGFYNSLLSNPLTVIKKLSSDTSMAFFNLGTRATAEGLGRIGLNSGAVARGETYALFRGYVGGMRDAFRAAGKALKAGESKFYGDTNSLQDGSFIDRTSKLANGAPEGLDIANPTRNATEWLRAALPTSWIGAADDFAKVANYRAEVQAMAYRDAVSKGLEGDALSQHVDLVANAPSSAIHEQAVASALRNTFQEPLEGIGQRFQELMDKANIPIGKTGVEIPVGRIIMPFAKISTNVMRFAYRTSPLPVVFPTANFRAMMAAGGATRDLANAQIGLGTAVSLIIAHEVMAGNITGGGPGDPEISHERMAAGIPSYSVRIDGKWISYNRIEPLATTIGLAADTIELMRYTHADDAASLAPSLVLGIGHAALSKTYVSGFADFLDAMRGDSRNGEHWLNQLGASMIPLSSLSRGIEAAADPWLRAHYDFWQTVAAQTPGYAKDLPPARTRWGDPLPRAEGFPNLGGLTRMLSPLSEGPQEGNVQPIDKWIWTNRDAFPEGPQGRLGLNAPGNTLNVQGTLLKLTPQQIDRLKVLAGNGLKDPSTGLGAKDALNALVVGQHPDRDMQAQFDKGTPAMKALIVQKIWNAYRRGAEQQLMSEDGSLQDSAAGAQAARASALGADVKQPSIGGGP